MKFIAEVLGLDKLEYPSFTDLLISFLIELTGLCVAVYEIAGFWKDRTNTQNTIMIFALIIFLFIGNVFLLNKIKEYRREILQREKFIELTARLANPECIVNEIHDVHEIKKNGDGVFYRHIDISRAANATKPVFWYEMSMGSTDNIQGRLLPKDFSVRSINGDKSLSRIWFSHIGSSHKYAIILDPVLDDQNTHTGFNSTRVWRGIWHKLWDKDEDDGRIKVFYPTTHLIYEVFLPKGYIFTEVKVDNRLGTQLTQGFDARSRAFFRIEAHNPLPTENNHLSTIDAETGRNRTANPPYKYSFKISKRIHV